MTHFNEVANQWDNPGKSEMMKKLAAGVHESLDPSKKYDIIDFGAGTGLFGLELLDIANSLVGIDTSDGMLDVFDKKTIDLDNVHSQNINLEEEAYHGEAVDIIISSMAFHHLVSPSQMIQKMKGIIRPSGKIIVVDLDKEDGTFHSDNEKMGVKHFGFSQEELERFAQEASMRVSNYKIIHSIDKNERNYPIFMCEFSN